jgi:hypothetical protein
MVYHSVAEGNAEKISKEISVFLSRNQGKALISAQKNTSLQ